MLQIQTGGQIFQITIVKAISQHILPIIGLGYELTEHIL